MRAVIVPLLAAGLAVAGCAQKSYVHREVGEVNQKVDAVSAEVEKTQERVRQNEVEIAKVDKESKAGVAEANASAKAAMDKATDAEAAAKGKLVYTLTLSNDKVQFPFAKSELSDEAKALIDDTIGPLVQKNAGVWFEVEGHTDATGDESYNVLLGEERAMAVRDYLAKSHSVALSRLEVISYGEKEPVADNSTRDGRSQNRRVVIRVLE
jgi:outer membrane protein OmpA-like peptidoglycan-associated protein